jgi:flagellar FliL protein
MKLIITSVVAIIFVALGSFAGVMLKSPSEAVAAAGDEAAPSSKGDDYEDDHGDEKQAKSGDKAAKSSGSGNSTYYKFSREFVVPIMREGQVTSLVIIHISLETDSSTAEDLFTEEPKLRDNIMTTLISLSNDGRTLERPTEINNYETIRSMVLMNLQDAISDKIKNVLIVDMAKQNL